MKIYITFNGEIKQVNFTKPQGAIVERFIDGDTFSYQGDALMWSNNERVYVRPLLGAIYAINRAFATTDGRNFFNI